MAKSVTLRVTIDLEEGSTPANLHVVVDETPADKGDQFPEAVRRLVEEDSPRTAVAFRLAYLEGAHAELGVSPRLPSTGKRRYVNVVPPRQYGNKRIAGLAPSSGRLQIDVDPRYADRFEHAEAVTNNDVPYAVKVYLDSDAAVRDALDLTRQALAER